MDPVLLGKECRERVNTALQALFAARQDGNDAALAEAMQYSLFAGGKRLRPLLVYAGARACAEPGGLADDAACAVELVHTYSLIHDDLPAMDDDDLRRGKPTCHRAFDEATAILAGDALQALAFEILTGDLLHAERRLSMCRLLARASGMQGMVLGQAIDLAAAGSDMALQELMRMHACKTGALISASVQLGAISVGAADDDRLQALRQCGDALGLAFQIRDDILDESGTTGELGKRKGADRAREKPTYTSMLGLKQARQEAQQARQEALDALHGFGADADFLRYLVNEAVVRTN